MSDKELDQLFQSRFEGFESEPSASLWSSIESQLGTKPQKTQTMPLFWMAAASVVVILGAGLWFLKPEQKVYLQGKGQLAVIKPQPVEVSRIEEPEAEEIAGIQAPVMSSIKVEKLQPKTEAKVVALATETNELTEPVLTENQVMMAKVELQEVNEEPARTSGFVAEEVHPHSRRGEVHQTVLAMLPPEETEQDQPVQQRRKIKSVGDIVNFVVAKVDQRDDKLIELSEDDEGTKISGINLGLFKIKSKKR